MTEQQRLEAELTARQKEVSGLEATLVSINKELETLKQRLEIQQQSIPLPTYQGMEPTITIEPAKVVTEKPVVLAQAEPLAEKIIFLDWLKKNWLWVGTGILGFTIIMILAKK